MNPSMSHTRPAPIVAEVPPAEAWIDDELMQSFPASDAPSWTLGTAHPIASHAAPIHFGSTP